MENCLVTKLKSVVNNDNLSKLGIVTLHVKSGTITNTNQQRFGFSTDGSTATLICKGNGYFGSTPSNIEELKRKTATLSDSISVFYFKNDDYTIEINNKYCLTELRSGNVANCIISLNINELSSLTSLIELSISDTRSTGDIKSLKALTNLQKLALSDNDVCGDISNLSSLVNIENLSLNNANIYGDIEALKNMTSLKVLSMNPNIYGDIVNLSKCTSIVTAYFANTSISGTLESFVSGQITNGRTTPANPILMNGVLLKASFGDKKYTDAVTYVDWESASKIGVLVGSAATPTKVYCKGYTQQEAETKWSGATIVRVDA